MINDYVRAKTMFADTQIKIFQKGEFYHFTNKNVEMFT